MFGNYIYPKKTALFLALSFSSIFLVSCGGSSNSGPEVIDPPTNTAPTVNITGASNIQERETLALTANASDSDGTVSTIAWSVVSGPTVSLISGDNSSDVSFTAPDVDEDTNLVLAVTVTDDDGETATSEITINITRVTSSVTITGLVTDNTIANANLEITIGGVSFDVSADENGVYSATINIDESLVNELVKIRALGDESINPEVEFVSLLTSVANLITQAGEDGILDSEDNFGVNVTNVSTAEFALIEQAGTLPTTDSELEAAQEGVDEDEKLTLATIIKIVVDGEGDDAFELPDGVTSTLDLIDDTTTSDAFIANINTEAPELIAATKSKIVNDSDLTVTQAIVGTWAPAGTSNFAITFLKNGQYIHVEKDDLEDDCDSDGFEVGNYSWDEETGIIIANTKIDTNGCVGVHDEQPMNEPFNVDGSFAVIDDELVITVIEDGETVTNTFSRVISDTNSLVGGWIDSINGDITKGNISFNVYFDESNFINLWYPGGSWTNDPLADAGIFYGTYAWDETTKLFTFGDDVVTSGASPVDESNIHHVSGDTLLHRENGWFITVKKRTHNSNKQPRFDKNDIIGLYNIELEGQNATIFFNEDGTGNTTFLSDGDSGTQFVWWLDKGHLAVYFVDDVTISNFEPRRFGFSPVNISSENWQVDLFFSYNNSSAGEPEGTIDDDYGIARTTWTKIEEPTLPTSQQAIVGTWTAQDQAYTSITFTASGHYIHMEPTTDDCGSDGYELGTYSWNENTGAITLTNIEDTNGCVGLREDEAQNIPWEFGVTLTVEGNTLTINDSDEPFVLNRVISDSNPIVGGYYEGDFDDNFFLIVFEENGNFLELAHDDDELGITLGTYSWDANTTLLDFNSISVNQSGSDYEQNMISIQGDVLTWTGNEDTGTMMRTHISSN